MHSNQLIEEMHFISDATWIKEKEGTFVSTEDKTQLSFSCPPILGGNEFPSPEDLFLASIATCTLTTLLHVCDRLRTSPEELNVKASGKLVLVDVNYEFRDIECIINVSGDKFLFERACELAIKYCAVGNAIKPPIKYSIIINSKKIRTLSNKSG
jgi:organic hydroperoxide reductase OsmC/OhrA